MSITSTAELRTAVNNWSDDSFTDGRIDEFIALAEAKFNRDLRTVDMEIRSQATLSDSYIALPSDFLELRSIHIEGSPDKRLEQFPIQRLRDIDLAGLASTPKAFAISDGQFIFAPATDTDVTVEIIYYGKIPSLLSNSSNWLLASHPDIYLYALQFEADVFEVNDERAASWKGLVDSMVGELNRQAAKKRYGSGPLIQRPPVVV